MVTETLAGEPLTAEPLKHDYRKELLAVIAAATDWVGIADLSRISGVPVSRAQWITSRLSRIGAFECRYEPKILKDGTRSGNTTKRHVQWRSRSVPSREVEVVNEKRDY